MENEKIRRCSREKNCCSGQSGDLTLALLAANAAAVIALMVLIKISKKKFYPTMESLRRAYSGIFQPEDYRE